MNLIISNAGDRPIYEQIYTQIKDCIISGELSEGDMLPSIRALAKDLRISVITTTRAYDELERDGFIYRVPGKGCYVAEKNVELVREASEKDRAAHARDSRARRALRHGRGGDGADAGAYMERGGKQR